ncbi:putative trafficking protein particle complex subunit 12 [Apostichopus japonicus]|uniref:Putative trafficking protein particle complex subunit 12 n=1 Tax=Stichopus japonicus TaxID=307972 RepID=A0A2G8LI10_STIJA|nr:putative trafficking protein particle complex subunit 12 [Apostichopus japonicus]
MEDPIINLAMEVDTLKELLYKYHIEDDVTKRKKTDSGSGDQRFGWTEKIIAVQLTGLLLTSVGQGKGQSGMPSQNTAESIQIWFTRLALLVKLRQFSTAELESQPFRDFDKPDLYYQYYPALYPGRKGSMVPFSFRVLVAEIPQFVSQHQQSMTRLYALLATCQKIVSNFLRFGRIRERNQESPKNILKVLNRNLSAFKKRGYKICLLKASLILWKNRVNRVQYSIGNCLLAMKDYYQSIKVFQSLSKTDPLNWCQIESLVGRIYLQLGDLKSAQETFTGIEKMSEADDQSAKIQVLINKLSTISVCLLYMGKLKSALNLLESLVNDEPDKYLDESILFNLCTLCTSWNRLKAQTRNNSFWAWQPSAREMALTSAA